jgi:hypothetical protein
MKVKLFIFESVTDALAFERREETTPQHGDVKVETARSADPETVVRADTEPDGVPVRRYKKPAKVHKTKAAKSGSRSSKQAKYDPDEVVKLAQKIADGKMTTTEAAAKLGVPMSSWYQAKATYAKHIKKGAQRAEEPKADAPPSLTLTDDELHAAIQGLKEDGLDSVRIAQKLKISLKTVNENW